MLGQADFGAESDTELQEGGADHQVSAALQNSEWVLMGGESTVDCTKSTHAADLVRCAATNHLRWAAQPPPRAPQSLTGSHSTLCPLRL